MVKTILRGMVRTIRGKDHSQSTRAVVVDDCLSYRRQRMAPSSFWIGTPWVPTPIFVSAVTRVRLTYFETFVPWHGRWPLYTLPHVVRSCLRLSRIGLHIPSRSRTIRMNSPRWSGGGGSCFASQLTEVLMRFVLFVRCFLFFSRVSNGISSVVNRISSAFRSIWNSGQWTFR